MVKWILLLLSSMVTAALPAHAQTDTASNSTTPSAIISRDVVIASGDTLASIAKRELDRAGFAPQLAEFNQLLNDAPLVPGDIIRIPIHVPGRGEFARVVFVKGKAYTERQPENPDSQATASQVPAQSGSADTAITGQYALPQKQLKRDDEITVGDTVYTGVDGFVSIEFSSGSVINLQPETEATLSRLNCLPKDDSCIIEVQALRGEVNSDVENRDSQPVDFRITTPYASAAVRGTMFDLSARPDALRVGVTEGSVGLSALNQTVDLAPGFGSLVKEGEAPGQPVELLPSPVFKRVPARLSPEDIISWWPFSLANSYEAKLSNDEQGNQTLASFSVSADNIGFDSIPAGDYFLRLRAIDSNGLQGFPANTRLTLADIDKDVVPVSTLVTKQGQEFLVQVQDPPIYAIGYEIQISPTATFEDPLSVDVNATGSAVFRLDTDQVFTRARVLLDPFTVSAFGSVGSSED